MTRGPAPIRISCLYCDYESDSAARIGGDGYRAPTVGDVSMCGSCGGLSIWTAYGLRVPTPIEVVELNENETIRAALHAWRTMKGKS
jgi:hypothetical protein